MRIPFLIGFLKSFGIKEQLKEIQLFFNRANMDLVYPIFSCGEVTIYFCPEWMYLEIIGLTNEERNYFLAKMGELDSYKLY